MVSLAISQSALRGWFREQRIGQLSKLVNVPVIASGGAGTMEHIREAFEHGADAALAASIFHYKEIDIMDLKHYLHDHNIPVRL